MSRSTLNSNYMRAKYHDDTRNNHHLDEMPKNKPSKYISTKCDVIKVSWLQEAGSFGGHSVKHQGHRMVSGIVRQKTKEEIRKEIDMDVIISNE